MFTGILQGTIPPAKFVTEKSWMKLFVVAANAGGGPAVNLTTLIVCGSNEASVGTWSPHIVKFVGAVK